MADQDRLSSDAAPWWSGATFYQVYVRSWRDSNGDGTGDLQGICERLDYLESLGIDGIWLSPTMPSPNTDWGYDVSDYKGVHPDLGTPDDLSRLVKEARNRGISVLLDLVPNHTSSAHPWFVEARSGLGAEHRDWYVWAPPKEGNAPPNNWISATGAPAWTYDEASGQYYLHNFLPTQPDLNWWNPAVHSEFESILRYWWDRGVAGFRIDVAHGLYKDEQLRDDPPATDADAPEARRGDLSPIYSEHRPEVHQVYRGWRNIADSYEPGRVLLGETWEFDPNRLGNYYGREAPELHLCFNFPFVFSGFSAKEIAKVVEGTLSGLPAGATPTWTASNHDVGRFPTRWCGGDNRAVKAALLVMATLPGTMVLYYGDEIGMTDVDIPRELQIDEMSLAQPGHLGRDRGRTPMPWTGERNAGFTVPSGRPWLPLGDHSSLNVQAQEADPESVLNFWRRLGQLRRSRKIGAPGRLETLFLDDQCWAYRAGGVVTIANLSPDVAQVALPLRLGKVLVSSSPEKEAGEAGQKLSLGPWEVLVADEA